MGDARLRTVIKSAHRRHARWEAAALAGQRNASNRSQNADRRASILCHRFPASQAPKKGAGDTPTSSRSVFETAAA